jgi:hypothetical protein
MSKLNKVDFYGDDADAGRQLLDNTFPNFGLDDAVSRHVSSPIRDAICATFLNRFRRWTPAPEPTARPLTDA